MHPLASRKTGRPGPYALALLASLALVPCLAASAAAQCTSPNWYVAGAPIVTGSNPAFTAIADFDHDGALDVVVTNSHTTGTPLSTLTLLRGAGDGTLAAAGLIRTGRYPIDVEAYDFDEDGELDLAVTCFTSDSIYLYRGLPAGTLGPASFAEPTRVHAPPGPHQLVVGDWDEDGIADLAVSLNGANLVGVLRGLGSGGVGNGTFAPMTTHALSNRPVGLAAADLNEDGILDLLATEYFSGTLAILDGQGAGGVGDGTFAPARHVAAGIEPIDIAVGDLDEDGILDLVVANQSSGGVRWLRGLGAGGTGDGTFAAPVSLGTGNIATVAVADLDLDGHLDVAYAQSAASTTTPLTVLPGAGDGTFGAARVTPGLGPGPNDIAIAQLDGADLLDLVVPFHFSNTISVLTGACAADPRAPRLDDVADVPNDQGGKVFVTWRRSTLDVTGGEVIGYRVWRRVPAAAAAARLARAAAAPSDLREVRRASPAGVTVEYWEALVTQPAQRLEAYGYTAATTQDSLPWSNPYTAFFVTAITPSLDVFYDSEVDSAYSVDNLAPPPPPALLAIHGAGQVQLGWQPSNAPDVLEYRVYRGPDAGFAADAASFVGATTQTSFADPGGFVGAWYRVLAVDVHRNAGPSSLTAASGPTAVLAAGTVLGASSESVRLLWEVSGDAVATVAVQRRVGDGAWTTLADRLALRAGRLEWTDPAPVAGALAAYRLLATLADGETAAGEIELRVPGWELALDGLAPNPGRGVMQVAFTLAARGPARLEVFDLAGRRVAAREVGDLGPGRHLLRLDGSTIPAGVYALRLASGGRTLLRRAVMLR